MIKKTETAL